MEPRVLFILKFREDPYYPYGGCDTPIDFEDKPKALSSGLLNSAKFVANMLMDEGVEVKLVQVVDNNDIDREVFNFKPQTVIIEALWVIPEKFDVLQKLHPTVQWVVRGHSDIPFLANEGVAIDWLTKYVHYKNVSIAANSQKSLHDLRKVIRAANPFWSKWEIESKVLFLPNYYPYDSQPSGEGGSTSLNIGCFGAIRPLKNQLIQAVAAIQYANSHGRRLRFHINANRNEQGGNNVLKNIRALFAATNHKLVEHDWLDHDQFLALLLCMDVILQVSFSETFNIVAADSVVMNIPVVVSPEISWVSPWVQANPTDSEDICATIDTALSCKWLLGWWNRRGLRKYCENSRDLWLDYLGIDYWG